MKNNLINLRHATGAALEVLEELAEIVPQLEHIQELAIEVKGSGILPVEAKEELENIANACGILIARGKE
tara:strand:+ start:367 stop:576 length:210 start_codon:yes stop_codon:yes gene_type:complete